MCKIMLNDILNLSEQEISQAKCRFMVPSSSIDYNPRKTLESETGKDEINLGDLVYNAEKKKPFREGVIAIGFVPLGDDNWLMTGIVRIIKENGYRNKCDAEYIEAYKKFNSRIVVRFHKRGMNGIMRAENILPKLEVVEIWPSSKEYVDNSFPGYKNVSVTYKELKKRLKTSEEWRAFLKARKGVYLISDTSNGKLYVGSAYGKNGIYGRWRTYMESGYDKRELEKGKYPNKEFQEIVREKGLTYIQNNFRYALLETFADEISDEEIISRESWWKEQLMTREFGYNHNQSVTDNTQQIKAILILMLWLNDFDL